MFMSLNERLHSYKVHLFVLASYERDMWEYDGHVSGNDLFVRLPNIEPMA